MLPARERLDADERAAGDRHDRLVVQSQLVAVDRSPQLALGAEPPQHARMHLRGRTARTGRDHAPWRGTWLRRRRARARRAGVRGGADRDADARGHRELVVSDHRGLAERGGDPLGDVDGVLLAGDVLAQHDELVAAEARDGLARPADRVAAAQHLREPVGQRHQQLVADLVPEAVVDQLEVVDVHEQNGHLRRPPLRPLEGAGEPVEQEPAIGQAGELVVQRLVSEPLLGLAPPRVLADLVADRGERAQQRVVEAVRPVAVELDHAEHLGAAGDRHPERAAQPFARRRLGARVVRLERRVLAAGRLARAPDAPERAGALLDHERGAERAELGRLDPVRLPQRCAAQPAGLLVQLPGGPELPVHALAERPQQSGHRLLEGPRIGEHARDRVLRGAVALGRAAHADVADVAGERGWLGALDPRDRELDRELAPVGTHGGQLDAAVEQRALAGLDVAREPAAMRVAQVLRHDQGAQLGADRLAARIAEGPLGGGVELEHAAGVIHGYDAVQRGGQHGRHERVARAHVC